MNPNPQSPEAYVRVSLMERVGFVRGFFNIREARAEPEGDPQTRRRATSVRVVGGGRALSWRWLREAEADRLLDERLGTLETMGYILLDSAMATRGRWDWLYDLVNRRLQRGAQESEQSEPRDALRDALGRLGLRPDEVMEGVASVLGLSVAALREPNARTIRETEPNQLAVLLPFLLHHERPEICQVGERWLRSPTLVYQLPSSTLTQWLQSDRKVSTLLAPRLREEGLAMLGPDQLSRLTRTGTPAVREAALAWVRRLRS